MPKIKADGFTSPERIDKFLTAQLKNYSRSYIQKLIDEGKVLCNLKIVRTAHYLVQVGDILEITIPEKQIFLRPMAISLDIIFEDNDLLIINKPPGIKVHPSNCDDNSASIVNAALYHSHCLSDFAGSHKLGIVHRLDKNTSGVLLLAKNNWTHQKLITQFQERSIEKLYLTLVYGRLTPKDGAIEAPVTRDKTNRMRMRISSNKKALYALSYYKVLDYFFKTSFLQVKIVTGRTHQIRLHLASIGFPVVGDDTYGNRAFNQEFKEKFDLRRQFLHAKQLIFIHPRINKPMKIEAELPKDLNEVMRNLKN